MKFFSALSFTLATSFASARLGSISHRKLVISKGESVPDQYIVVLNDKVVDPRLKISSIMQQIQDHDEGKDISIEFEYLSLIKGVTLSHVPPSILRMLLDDPDVSYVQSDNMVEQFGVQENPPWGLDRIDQEGLPLDGKYEYEWTGAGVTAFVIDGGIRMTHEDFGGRVRCGLDLCPGEGEECSDMSNHATHVAGILGGSKYGVAKDVEIVSVKAYCYNETTGLSKGTISTMLAAYEYVRLEKAKSQDKPMLINLSGGREKEPILDVAVEKVIDAGLHFFAAAGNDRADACGYSPGHLERVITVGATKEGDRWAKFSNNGPCVDILAPGHTIMSASYLNDTDAFESRGTSLSAPHVAGVAALYLEKDPFLSPEELWTVIKNDAIRNKITEIPDEETPNLLVSTEKLKSNGFITGVSFVNADTNTVIGDVEDGGVYFLSELSTYLNMKANVNDDVTTVKFSWGENGSRTERVAPFAMGGDVGGNYFGTSYLTTPGEKNVTVEAFNNGVSLQKYSITFKIAQEVPTAPPTVNKDFIKKEPTATPTVDKKFVKDEPSSSPSIYYDYITGFSFVNADTNAIVRDIEDGGVYSLSELGNNLYIKANVNNFVKIAYFTWGTEGIDEFFSKDGEVPFSIGGGFLSKPGTKFVAVDVYFASEGWFSFRSHLDTLSISFDIVE